MSAAESARLHPSLGGRPWLGECLFGTFSAPEKVEEIGGLGYPPEEGLDLDQAAFMTGCLDVVSAHGLTIVSLRCS